MSPKKALYSTMVYHRFGHHHIKKKKKIQRPTKPKRKKKGRPATFTARLRYPKKEKKVKWKCGQFCLNIFVHFLLLFSFQFQKIVFWREGEKTCGPHQNLSSFPLSTKNIIFSLFFSHLFSILPKITPTKHSLRELLSHPDMIQYEYTDIWRCIKQYACIYFWGNFFWVHLSRILTFTAFNTRKESMSCNCWDELQLFVLSSPFF